MSVFIFYVLCILYVRNNVPSMYTYVWHVHTYTVCYKIIEYDSLQVDLLPRVSGGNVSGMVCILTRFFQIAEYRPCAHDYRTRSTTVTSQNVPRVFFFFLILRNFSPKKIQKVRKCSSIPVTIRILYYSDAVAWFRTHIIGETFLAYGILGSSQDGLLRTYLKRRKE